MSKKVIEADIVVTDLEFPNNGIAFFNDKKIFIKNSIPEQKLKLTIKKKKHKFEGKINSVLEKAPYEIEPECKKFSLCGGCNYQNIEYEKELEFKKNNVLKLLNNVKCNKYEFLGIAPSPNIKEYRNKMEFSFGDNGIKGELTLGMRKRESYYEVINADECNLIDSDIRKILSIVQNYFKNSNENFYHRTKRTGSLRHLLVRKAYFTSQIIIGLVTTSNFNTDLEYLKNLIISESYTGKIVCFAHIINDSISDVVKADFIDILFGSDYFFEEILGLKFKISIFSFFQTNSAAAEVLYSTIIEFIGNIKDKTIFDLYCGTGTISQIISKSAKHVIGIEIVDEAVKAAKDNANLNGLNNCEFITGDVLKVIDEISEKPDLIILDPPREGINPKAINKIIKFDADKIVYISCKASSMVRDLQFFIENGYEISKIKCVDMFPRTYHVETVVLLSKLNPDEYIEVDLDLDEFDITSSEAKATYAEIQNYVKEKYNVKVSTLYISQIKRKCGLEMGTNYNTAKSENSRVPVCPIDKEKYIMEALKHFKMI